MEMETYRSSYYPDKDIQIPISEDHRPSPIVLVPGLAAYYDVKAECFKLMCNGVPVGDVDIAAQNYHEPCEQLTKDIWALVRKLVDLHKVATNE